MKKTTHHTDPKLEAFLQKVKAHAISAFITFFSSFLSIFSIFLANSDFENLDSEAFVAVLGAGVITSFRGAVKIMFQSFLPKK